MKPTASPTGATTSDPTTAGSSGFLDLLPRGVPVLCCTATANDRVVEDVMDQLGSGLAPLKGPLGREGLRTECAQDALAKGTHGLARRRHTAPGGDRCRLLSDHPRH